MVKSQAEPAKPVKFESLSNELKEFNDDGSTRGSGFDSVNQTDSVNSNKKPVSLKRVPADLIENEDKKPKHKQSEVENSEKEPSFEGLGSEDDDIVIGEKTEELIMKLGDDFFERGTTDESSKIWKSLKTREIELQSALLDIKIAKTQLLFDFLQNKE